MAEQQIRNIIFDLGGVILHLDYHKTTDAFIELGVKDFHELYSQMHASSLFKHLECGKITPKHFLDEINKYSTKTLPPEKVINAWNAMLLGFPPARMKLLKELKGSFRTFLLSNTNIIHFERFQQLYRDACGEGGLEDCFEKVYYSHAIGLRKPNKEAYEFVLDGSDLKPEETLFIDDTLPNVEAAKALGIQSIYLAHPQEMEHLFAPGPDNSFRIVI